MNQINNNRNLSEQTVNALRPVLLFYLGFSSHTLTRNPLSALDSLLETSTLDTSLLALLMPRWRDGIAGAAVGDGAAEDFYQVVSGSRGRAVIRQTDR